MNRTKSTKKVGGEYLQGTDIKMTVTAGFQLRFLRNVYC